MDRKRIQPQFQTYTHFSNLQSNLVFKIHQFWWNLPNSVFEVLPWNPPKKQTMQRDRVLEIGISPSNLVHCSTHSWNLPNIPKTFSPWSNLGACVSSRCYRGYRSSKVCPSGWSHMCVESSRGQAGWIGNCLRHQLRYYRGNSGHTRSFQDFRLLQGC